MNIISKLQTVAYIIIAVLIIFMLLGFCLWFFYFKRRRTRVNSKEGIDYSSLQRQDSKDYIKLDDIKDDVIITDGGTRFVGVIKCRGYDFYSADITEQGSTVKNYMSFINTINAPITYRQYCKSADLEGTSDMYMEAYSKVCSKLNDLYLQTEKITQNYNKTNDSHEKELYAKSLTTLSRELSALESRKFHIEDQLVYIESFSGKSVAPLLSETYVFDWKASNFDLYDKLSDDELFEKAKLELTSISNNKIHALNAAGVRATRCTTEDLIDMCRRLSQPISSERFKKRDLENCNFDSDIISSDSIERLNKQIQEILTIENKAIVEDVFSSDSFNDLPGEELKEPDKIIENADEDAILSF